MARHHSVRVVLAVGALALAARAAEAGPAQPSHLDNHDWTMAHVGPNGLAKCRAFKQVRDHTVELQKADHGDLTAMQRKRLNAEMIRAKAMSPGNVTPAKCGVPL